MIYLEFDRRKWKSCLQGLTLSDSAIFFKLATEQTLTTVTHHDHLDSIIHDLKKPIITIVYCGGHIQMFERNEIKT